ncbi:MAG: hypothetical protein V1667_01280 [bacterium]
MINKKILASLTTITPGLWRKKAEEINELGLEEIALFLTGLNVGARKELYGILEKTKLKNIPHVHLRDDMDVWELEYLESRFNAAVFNIHGKNSAHPFDLLKLKKYLPKIYIENQDYVPDREELKKTAGFCVDFSHWQDGIMLKRKNYDANMRQAIKNFSVGCSHISAVGKKVIENRDVVFNEIVYRDYSKHIFDNLEEFDYIANFLDFLPDLISLELENSLAEQLKAKKYLEKIIL